VTGQEEQQGEFFERQFGIAAAGGAAELGAVESRHHRVDHAQVDRRGGQCVKGRPPVTSRGCLETGTGQQRLDQLPDVRIVIDHQNCRHGCALPSLLAWPPAAGGPTASCPANVNPTSTPGA
jgi:hypothetical protein